MEGRYQGVDAVRLLAIVFVIAIHTTPFERPGVPVGSEWDAATVVNEMARFAVPFFFVVSGYFWGKKITDRRAVWKVSLPTIRRLSVLFVVWSALYLLPWNVYDAMTGHATGTVDQFVKNLRSALGRPVLTLLQGTRGHLWFLSSLVVCVCLASLFVRFGRDGWLYLLSFLLFMIGLAGKAYQDAPWGFDASFNFRNGPFFALAFFVTGYGLQKRPPLAQGLRVGAVMAVAGCLLQAVELMAVHRLWGTTMCQDFVAGTNLYGVGVALMALSKPGLCGALRLQPLAQLVLGVYVSHIIFVDLLGPLERASQGSVLGGIASVAAVFGLSLSLAWVLAQWPWTRRLVS